MALAGGPSGAVGVKDPALLHVCPSGPHTVTTRFSLVAGNGRRYQAYINNLGAWSARLPAGTYRAVGAAGCGAESPFVVTAGKTRKGIVVWWGCDYS